MLHVLCLAVVLVCAIAASALPDPRLLSNGILMTAEPYLDQPYCVITAKQRIVCLITVDKEHEGGAGEHVSSLYSDDNGRTWSPLLPLETGVDVSLDNSYSTIAITPYGRIYGIYDMNLYNVTKLPNGAPATRRDTQGVFVMRFSDDDGESWSSERYVVPHRETAIDRNNSFNGKTQMFWGVDQTKFRSTSMYNNTGTAYFAYTSIGTYLYKPPEEVFILSSPNLMTETDPTKLTWVTLPEGDHGLAPPGGNPNIFEEPHVLPLLDGGFYLSGRTTQGYLGATSTSDSTGASGWAPTTFAQFFDAQGTFSSAGHVVASGRRLKNPRGPTTSKMFSNGRFLLLWYFNSGLSYVGRDPYWLSSGVVQPGTNTVLWSQPEIGLYDKEDHTDRPGYPDFVELASGEIAITETQKTQARFHPIDATLLSLLFQADSLKSVTTTGLHYTWLASDRGSKFAMPPVPPFNVPAPVSDQGVSFDATLANHGAATTGQLLLDSRGASDASTAAGITVTVGANHTLVVTLSDGNTTATLATDSACTAALLSGDSTTRHYFGFVADAGANVLLVMVDGYVCDGGTESITGWAWISNYLKDATGGSTVVFSPSYGGDVSSGRLYTRPVRTTELVSNYRASVL